MSLVAQVSFAKGTNAIRVFEEILEVALGSLVKCGMVRLKPHPKGTQSRPSWLSAAKNRSQEEAAVETIADRCLRKKPQQQHISLGSL